MWIPADAEELERLINDRALEESANLDFKAELPSSGKELAKDVAAMANDGGTLVFGVREDLSGCPAILQPFKLAGAAERVSSIVHSCLAESPTVDIRALATKEDAEKGYLVVVIPASPRAPHMVVVKGDNRFYGRAAKGNMPLNEGDVARLYQRRQQWEQDRDAHLDQAVSEMALEPHPDYGFLYMFARPVSLDPKRLAALGDRDAQRSTLSQMMMDITRTDVWPDQYSLSFSSGGFRPISAGWRAVTGGENIASDPERTLNVEIHFDCEARLVYGRAAHRHDNRVWLFQGILAEAAVRFLTLAGRLLQRTGYFGAVDVGLAVTGIKGSAAEGAMRGFVIGYLPSFDQESFQETGRFMSNQLESAASAVARDLLSRLLHACGAVGHADPFRSRG